MDYRRWFEQLFAKFLRQRQLPEIPQSVLVEPPQAGDARYEQIFGTEKIGGEPPDWEIGLPMDEFQGLTGDCVSHASTNIVEAIAKYRGIPGSDGGELNLSALHLAVQSGTTARGNSLRAVVEILRKKGVVEERYCTYDADMLDNPFATWAKRQAKVNAIPANAPRYKIDNYSVLPNHVPAIKEALLYSPVLIAVGLGETYRRGGIIQTPQFISSYHAMMDYRVVDSLKVLDSYLPTRKQFASNYPIVGAISFRTLPDNWKQANNNGIALINRLKGKYILRGQTPPAHGELYYLFPDGNRLQYLPEAGLIPLFQEFLKFLRTQGLLTGINEVDFATLTNAIKSNGGVIN